MEANSWNYLCSQPLSAFRIVYSTSNRAWGAGSQPCDGTSPCVYHPVYPMGALFFRFDARTHLASGKVTNKLPVDFLESSVQTVHTAEMGAFASALVSPLYLPRPPPSWHRRWVCFLVPTGELQ